MKTIDDILIKFWENIINKLNLDNLNDIFYVNGSETLPPPLSAEEEVDIVSRLDNDPSLKTILIERNLRLVVYIAKRFENSGAGIEDLISIGTIGLMKAINTFKTDKNIKLATYASRCIENEILMYMRKNANIKNEISIDEPLNVDWDGNELLLSDILGSDSDIVYRNIEESEEKKMIFSAMAKLGKREKIIISMRFGLETGKEKTQKEVADILGISQSYISRLEKKIINKLKREIAKSN
ncbi:MAG: RNA polymerase sporulation sigma factor SigE [Oscillospiraceae bacterium]|nr:RNA polymerase sporulation sigma factor SigE [Oscillospiraceae bacterium]